jgi:predicted Zn-dependent peptidase
MIHLPDVSPVACCGLAVNAGARDERPDESGLAHFVEHMLFKGTQKRKAWHILNRMENVGGELNASTSREETLIYAVFRTEDYGRAVELIADIVLHSRFPDSEVDRERDVILDEIRSYEDSPSELIFDEFENLLFEGHPLGHHILGNRRSLRSFGSQSALDFVRRRYTAGNMVFFSLGSIDFRRAVRLADKYLSDLPARPPEGLRQPPPPPPLRPLPCLKKKKTRQAHVLTGGRAFDLYDARRIPLLLLNNLLGGPGMNSRLNVSLREKRGLVYSVESCVAAYTDTGLCAVYFGTDPKNREQVTRLTHNELQRLRDHRLSDFQLAAAKKQLTGQLAIAAGQKENLFLGLGKSFLHRNRYEPLPALFAKIHAVSAAQLQDIAAELFAPERLFTLIYE